MYRGRSGSIEKNKIPSYEGPNTAVLFHDDGEDPLIIKWQRAEKILIIESVEFKQTIDMKEKGINIALGDKFVLDTNGLDTLKLEMDKFLFETDGSTATVDVNGSTIEIDNSITINGNLEVLK
jgi:hypothetical protein